MPLPDRLKKLIPAALPVRSGPIWAGPESDAKQGGITQGLLGRFLCCRERFRLYAVLGLRPAPTFNHRLEFGNLWHAAEEALALDGGERANWETAIRLYARELCRKYPTQQEQVDHWYRVCKVQFPVYVDYWALHPHVLQGTPLLSEYPFKVPYKLPSGRTVYLRGKWDSVDHVKGKDYPSEVWVMDNKTKGDPREQKIKQQLKFDLQTMFYFTALEEGRYLSDLNAVLPEGCLLRGVRYNVVRRPLSGGKYSITRHKPTKSKPDGETKDDFYARLGQLIQDDPGHFFMRWEVPLYRHDVDKFRRTCLDPILEQLCEWWNWVTTAADPFSAKDGIHWRFPYGIWNPLLEDASTDLDDYLDRGENETGLRRTTNLFPELQDD